MLNKVVIVGNLTKDPEVRYTAASGAAVTNLRLACNRKYKSGEVMKEETCYINAVVWGKRAENCGQYLQKGIPVFIEGRLQSRSWDNAQGVKQYATEIVAENIQFLNRAKEGTSADKPMAESEEREIQDNEEDFLPPDEQ